jgi:GNAT superfamily N-acetyltransferase
MGEVVIARQETWVADIDGSPAGFVSLTGDDVDQLYLAPDRRGQGLGYLLIEKAKAQRPGGLSLWTFQVNEPARRFYLRHGFREVERTDGEHNEEREPDIRMRWQPRGR